MARIKFTKEDLRAAYQEAMNWQPPAPAAPPVDPEAALQKVLQSTNGGSMMPKMTPGVANERTN